ncbi:MAG TPA: hypothetical protein VF885_15570 [Arthrobacter sp.]
MSAVASPNGRSRRATIAWAGRQKDAVLSAAQSAAMDATYPGWRETHDGVWFSNLETVEAFLARHGRLPSSASEDRVEAFAGAWVARQRCKTDLAPARKQALETRAPQVLMRRDDVWLNKLSKTVAFYTAHGRLPSMGSSDAGELSLARWLIGVKKYAQSVERIKAIDAQLPVWRDLPEDAWSKRLDWVAAFVAANGRFPAANARDDQGRKHASWLRRHLEPEVVPPDQLAALDERIPGWNRNFADAWDDQLEAVRNFLSEHGRFPLRGTGRPVEEQKAGSWLYKQCRNPKLKSAREAIMDEQLPGWREIYSGRGAGQQPPHT